MGKFLTKLLILILVILGLVYLVGLLYAGDHFMFNTKINNTDVSLQSVSSANLLLSNKHPEITIIQKNKDGKDNIEQKIDLIDEAKGDIVYDSSELINNQNRFLWFMSLFNNAEFNCDKVSGNIDVNELDKAINKLYCLQSSNIIEPKNAHYELVNGSLQIVKEDDGCYIEEKETRDSIKTFVGEYLNGSAISALDLTEKYKTAEIKADDASLINMKDNLQKVLDKTVEIIINSNYSDKLNGSKLSDLLILENNEYKVNEEELNEYVLSLSNKYDVSSYEYIDKGALITSLSNVLLNDQDTSINISWIKTKQAHIEVSIGKQMLWYYEGDDLLLTSDLVSGYGDTATPQETFYIQFKKEKATLRGADYTEYVDYWIGFGRAGSPYDGGHILGFHDASWRDQFGGEIYLTDPSHGCLNLPTEKAKQLYELADIGTEIHIYQ